LNEHLEEGEEEEEAARRFLRLGEREETAREVSG